MRPEIAPDQQDPYNEALLFTIERLPCSDDQKEMLRRMITSDRTCDVVRSDGRRERGKIIGIGQDGRIAVAVQDEGGKNSLIKRPHLETFMSWQEPSENP